MRTCRVNLALSAQAALYGDYHFEHTPMAPPGTNTIAHVKPSVRSSYGYHAQEAWYVGPALKHYQCYKAISKKTGAEIISDTVQFKFHNVSVPTNTPIDRLVKATNDLTQALNLKPPPQLQDHIEVVERLRTILTHPTKRFSPTEIIKSRNRVASHPETVKIPPRVQQTRKSKNKKLVNLKNLSRRHNSKLTMFRGLHPILNHPRCLRNLLYRSFHRTKRTKYMKLTTVIPAVIHLRFPHRYYLRNITFALQIATKNIICYHERPILSIRC